MTEGDALVNWLLEQDATVVLQWLHEMIEGTRPIPEGFNWVGLGECATSQAFQKVDFRSGKHPQPDLGWARVEALAYCYAIEREKHSSRLAQKPSKKKHSYLSLEYKLMTIQAQCILAYGSREGDPLLDPNQLIACLLEDMAYSPEDVQQRFAGAFEPLTSEEYLELLRIRTKLQVLRSLQDEDMLPPHPTVLAWIAVWEQTHLYWSRTAFLEQQKQQKK